MLEQNDNKQLFNSAKWRGHFFQVKRPAAFRSMVSQYKHLRKYGKEKRRGKTILVPELGVEPETS